MRIAQVAPLFESVPPGLYGGTERIVSYLTEELVRQGHEVTLFASGDSRQPPGWSPAARGAVAGSDVRETLPQHVRLVELVFQQASRFDVLNFHVDYLHFCFTTALGSCRISHWSCRGTVCCTSTPPSDRSARS